MTIDRKRFFDGIRQQPFAGKLTTGQVQGVTVLLNEWERRALLELRWFAYMLATVKWETAHSMQPIKEGGGIGYLRSKRYYPWYGRGYVQLTWRANYEKFRDRVRSLFNEDLIANADAALRPDIAAFIAFEGMLNGEFTGKKLSMYFNATTSDWINARRIINGVDKAAVIAGIAKQFYADLAAASS